MKMVVAYLRHRRNTMAIAVILDLPGGTLEQYDRELVAIGLKPGEGGRVVRRWWSSAAE
jgi:hypothetical protein